MITLPILVRESSEPANQISSSERKAFGVELSG
jgi:hypothetical protein